MLKVATFCSGIGSPEEAIKELGIEHEVVFACERDKYAKQTYLANHTANMMFDDMTTMNMGQEGIYADLIVSGIPCQSFSLAGKRLGELDPRGLLFYNFYDYVKQQRPKYFIIENVKGLLSTERVFETWLELLGQSVNNQHNMFQHEDSLMYNLHWTVLNSKDFGVPQNRERVFIIGIRPDLPNNFRFPLGFPLTKRLKDILEPVVDEKYYLSDKMLEYMNTRSANFNNGKINYKTGEDTASCINASSKSIDISDNIIIEGEVTPNSQAGKLYSNEGIFPTVSAGTHGYALGYTREPICVAMRGRNPENSSDRTTGANTEQRLEPNSKGITNTITSVQKDNLIITNRIRRLTPKECMRLMDFSDIFVQPVSDSQKYRQAGNSIVVGVIKAIINNLLNL